MVGSLAPRAPAPPRLRCLLPTRGGGTGGSNFFFFCVSVSKCGGRRERERRGEMCERMSGMKEKGRSLGLVICRNQRECMMSWLIPRM